MRMSNVVLFSKIILSKLIYVNLLDMNLPILFINKYFISYLPFSLGLSALLFSFGPARRADASVDSVDILFLLFFLSPDHITCVYCIHVQFWNISTNLTYEHYIWRLTIHWTLYTMYKTLLGQHQRSSAVQVSIWNIKLWTMPTHCTV